MFLSLSGSSINVSEQMALACLYVSFFFIQSQPNSFMNMTLSCTVLRGKSAWLSTNLLQMCFHLSQEINHLWAKGFISYFFGKPGGDII